MGESYWIIYVGQYNHKVLIRGREEGQSQRRRLDNKKAEVRESWKCEDATVLALKTKKGAISQGVQVALRSWKDKKENFHKEYSSADPFYISDFQNYKRINLYFF